MTKAFIQKSAPYFEGDAVVNGEFKHIKLTDYKGKYVILCFYPMDFTFVCPTEILALNAIRDQLHAIHCELIMCSVDSKYTHLAWVNTPKKDGGLGAEMKLPLLSDFTRHISQDYGVLIEDGDCAGAALRGLFIIDDKQILRQITINDLPVGRSAEEVIRLVKAFQFSDQHGVVCPANWQPGSDTLKGDPQESKKYFAKHA